MLSHYGVMSGAFERMNGNIPHSLLAYFLHLDLIHSGTTIDEVLALPERDFAIEASRVLTSASRDAAFTPYEPDRTLSEQIFIDLQQGKIGKGQSLSWEHA
jgi:hypothetical protein